MPSSPAIVENLRVAHARLYRTGAHAAYEHNHASPSQQGGASCAAELSASIAFEACSGPAPRWFLRQAAAAIAGPNPWHQVAARSAADSFADLMAAELRGLRNYVLNGLSVDMENRVAVRFHDPNLDESLRAQRMSDAMWRSGGNHALMAMPLDVRVRWEHTESLLSYERLQARDAVQRAIRQVVAVEKFCGVLWELDDGHAFANGGSPFGPLDIPPDALAARGYLPFAFAPDAWVRDARFGMVSPADMRHCVAPDASTVVDVPRFPAHNVALAANLFAFLSGGSASPAKLFADAWHDHINELRYAAQEIAHVRARHEVLCECSHCHMNAPDYAMIEDVGGNDVCVWCVYRDYFECGGCEGWVLQDEYCPCGYGDEYLEDADGGDCGPLHVNYYSYKPAPMFHFAVDSGIRTADSERYVREKDPDRAAAIMFGVELETQIPHGASAHHGGRALVESEPFRIGFMYAKSDCSVSGPELVTHPATLEAHRMMWSRFPFAELVEAGWRAWPGASAGLHVHISRRAFHTRKSHFAAPDRTYRSDAHLARFALLFGSWREELTAFFGRNDDAYAYHGQAMRYKVCDIAKGHRHPPRSSAVNYLPADTIEVRMPRASLREDAVMAYLEFLHALVRYSEQKTSSHVRHEDSAAFPVFHDWMCEETEYDYSNAITRINNRVCERTN